VSDQCETTSRVISSVHGLIEIMITDALTILIDAKGMIELRFGTSP
jgi:hypothetical protein